MLAVAPREITIEAELHPAQEEVWTSPARFRVVACGRRFGKTWLAVLEILTYAMTHDGSVCWWVAPVHDQSDIAFRMLMAAMSNDMLAMTDINLTKKTVVLWNGARIVFKSADRDKNLRGEGVWFMVVDEAAFLKETSWYGALRPSLADHQGSALLIGTFDGDNWFYLEYLNGQNPDMPEYASWRFPTSANPYIAPEEIEHNRRMLPHEQFEQEFLANPMIFVGAVFNGEQVERAARLGLEREQANGGGTFSRPHSERIGGVDWGFNNPTAFEVAELGADDEVHWVYEQQWHATELNVRCKLIAEFCKYNELSDIYADAAGADENFTLREHLYKAGAETKLTPVPFNKYKMAGIQARRWFLENGRESISPNCPGLIHDSKRYRYAETQQGVKKDDVVKENDHTVDAATAAYAVRFGDVAGRD